MDRAGFIKVSLMVEDCVCVGGTAGGPPRGQVIGDKKVGYGRM